MPEQAPSHEAFKESINPELSVALNEAAHYVTNNIDLIINGQLVEHPFEGTFTTAAVIAGARSAEDTGPEILAAATAQQRSEHLEDEMGYGDLNPIAYNKAKQLLEIAEKVPAEKLRASDPQAAGTMIESGVGHAYLGGTRIDNNRPENHHTFVIATSGSEGTRAFIKAIFPNETFDFDVDPTQLERGAGLLDELVSRMVGGVMILKALGVKFGDERIQLKIDELQQPKLSQIEVDLKNVPGNTNEDGSQKISID